MGALKKQESTSIKVAAVISGLESWEHTANRGQRFTASREEGVEHQDKLASYADISLFQKKIRN